jgi:hypothetical protein
MVAAFQANEITPRALFDTDQERVSVLADHDLDLLAIDLNYLDPRHCSRRFPEALWNQAGTRDSVMTIIESPARD